MNFTEINHCLTTAINNLAEGEIDVAALAMAEDLEREELEEATKRKNTQRARDRRAFKKYGVKFRNTKRGHTLAINKKGKIAGGNPHVIKDIPAKDKAPSAMDMGTAKPKKKSAASKLRDQLAKAKKKMGKSFNAMLAQSDESFGNLTEATMPKDNQTMKIDGEKFKVVRVYPTKDHADGPLPSSLLRLMKKSGGGVLLKKQSDGEPYFLYLGAGGKADGAPIWLKPQQYKRIMSYEY